MEMWGVVGIIIFMLVWIGYRFYTRRDSFMVMLRGTETAIFQKPLDKDMWDKGEMKNTKVKIIWGKKKNETKRSNQ